MPAEADPPAGMHHPGGAFGDGFVAILFGHKPLAAAPDHSVEQFVWDIPSQLRVPMHLGRLEVVILAPRRAVGDEYRWRVERLRPGDELRDVVIQRVDRQRMFIARKPVGHQRQVKLHVQAAF